MQYKIYEIEDNRDNADLMVNETVFHNANGYIGVRSDYEEGYQAGYDTIRGSYINGFYDIADIIGIVGIFFCYQAPRFKKELDNCILNLI